MKVEVGKHQLAEERYVQNLTRYGSTIRRYRSYIIGGVLIVILAGIGLILLLHNRTERSDKAWPAVAKMDSADGVSDVEDLAMGTDAEPFFIMEAGTLLFERGEKKDLEKAEELYRRFCTRWRKHPGVEYAKQSLGCVLEQQERYGEAMEIFASLAQEEGSLADQSLWDAGRCAEKAQNIDRAKGFYIRLTSMGDTSAWTRYAEARLAELLSEKKMKSEPKKEEHDG